MEPSNYVNKKNRACRKTHKKKMKDVNMNDNYGQITQWNTSKQNHAKRMLQKIDRSKCYEIYRDK